MKNKGVTLYLAVLVMMTTLTITLGLSTILFTQVRTISGLQNSVMAFSAADSGIERILDLGSAATTSGSYSGSLDNNATWTAKVINPGGSDGGVECPADTENFCVNSRGGYGDFERAIQISR